MYLVSNTNFTNTPPSVKQAGLIMPTPNRLDIFMTVVGTFGVIIAVFAQLSTDFHSDAESMSFQLKQWTTSIETAIENLKASTTTQFNSILTTMEAMHAETGTRLASLDQRMTNGRFSGASAEDCQEHLCAP